MECFILMDCFDANGKPNFVDYRRKQLKTMFSKYNHQVKNVRID